MNWIQHSIVAIILACLVVGGYVYYKNPALDLVFFTNTLVFISAVAVASIVPDLDSSNSTFFRIVELGIGAIIAFFVFTNYGWKINSILIALGVFILFRMLASLIIPRHRGFIHSISFLLILLISTYIFLPNPLVLLGFAFGFWCHLLCDGVPFKVW